MKPDETGDTVEFAIKLQDVLVPVDSHWPIEKFKEIDNAYHKDKEALAHARKDLASALETRLKLLVQSILLHQKRQTLQLCMHPQKDYLQNFQVIVIQRQRTFTRGT